MSINDNNEVLGEGPAGYSINKPTIDLQLTNNFKPLTSAEAYTHLRSLDDMLKKLSRFMYDKVEDKELRHNSYVQNYMLRLGEALHTVALRNEVQSIGSNSDVKQDIVIDPTNSGFPLMSRDMALLRIDQEQAESILKEIPDDKEIVEAAINSCFHRLYPNRQIRQMMERKYYSKLLDTNLPKALEVDDAVFLKESQRGNLYKKNVEKLDDGDNIPRFYTIYYEIPKLSITNGGLKDELKRCIVNDGLSTIASLELHDMADRLEQIDGVQIQLVSRFDLGPFYSKFTENSPEISALLEGTSPGEGIIAFTKNYVLRESETPVKGFRNIWRAQSSGDDMIGKFSDVISKSYMIMPHKLIQKADKQGIDFGNIELVPVTKEGDFS